MKLEKIVIEHYRSIEKIEIEFFDNVPIVLFGPNNAGKSNILKAIDVILGEKYPSYYEFQDTDYFLRNKEETPNIHISVHFDSCIKPNDKKSNVVCISTLAKNVYHYVDNSKCYLSQEDRKKVQFMLVDATRDINRQLSYYSQYSLLSKMSKSMHKILVQNQKNKLQEHFKNIKDTFESVAEYKNFYEKLQNVFQNNINGFEHKLDIDLSAYDPNNYFNSLRIVAKEGSNTRAFEEFGTGEQQILLLSFLKAYAEVFKGEYFILGIEEPEAHLHPLAQKWLARNIKQISESGVQVILSTHSPEFLDINNLEGFVRVYKESEKTKIIQNSKKTLVDKCIKMKANPQKTKEETVLPFYVSNTFYDQLKGFFARKIILVEGPTELFALPNYFQNSGYDLIKNGIEIIDCRGKSQIARNYRLFSSYGYECFCLFDRDDSSVEKKRGNEELSSLLDFKVEDMGKEDNKFYCEEKKKYGYFGDKFESYLKKHLRDYEKKEKSEYSKVLNAKMISENNKNYQPSFVESIAKVMGIEKT